MYPSVRSGYVNTDGKKLMLAHAFASGARRVELLTYLRNAWSQAAIAKLGAMRAGVLRRDRKTWTGHIRDTVVFSITDFDCPTVSKRLAIRVAGQKGGLIPSGDVLRTQIGGHSLNE